MTSMSNSMFRFIVVPLACLLVTVVRAESEFSCQFTPVPISVSANGVDYVCISTVGDRDDPRFDGPVLVLRKDVSYTKRAWHIRDFVGISRSSVLLLGGEIHVSGPMILIYFDGTDSVSVLSMSYTSDGAPKSLPEIKELIETELRKTAQPGATDNPDGAQ